MQRSNQIIKFDVLLDQIVDFLCTTRLQLFLINSLAQVQVNRVLVRVALPQSTFSLLIVDDRRCVGVAYRAEGLLVLRYL